MTEEVKWYFKFAHLGLQTTVLQRTLKSAYIHSALLMKSLSSRCVEETVTLD